MENQKIEDLVITDEKGHKKTIGYIKGDQFRKIIKGSKHIMKKLNAVGIDEETWRKVIVPECEDVVIYDEESEIYYYARISFIDKVKKYYQFNHHKKQIFLPLDQMDRKVRKRK